MAKDRKIPCKVRDGSFLDPCVALAECVGGNGLDKRKGIVEWTYINMTTGEATRSFIGVKSGAHAERGIIFNHCPFCGTKIDEMVQEKTEAA